MKKKSDPERELVQVTAEDLRYLKEQWAEPFADSQLRITSTTLRRLLIEGIYGRAWRAAGFTGQPTIRALTLEPFIQRAEPRKVLYASPGGTTLHGATIGFNLQ